MMLPLKQLRENKQMTQAELSKILKISPSAVGMWEQGRRLPDYDNLKRISKIFKVSTDYLLDNDSEKNDVFSIEETNLVKDYRWLTPDDKNFVQMMIKKLRGVKQSKARKREIKKKSENGNNYGLVSGNFSPKVTIR